MNEYNKIDFGRDLTNIIEIIANAGTTTEEAEDIIRAFDVLIYLCDFSADEIDYIFATNRDNDYRTHDKIIDQIEFGPIKRVKNYLQNDKREQDRLIIIIMAINILTGERSRWVLGSFLFEFNVSQERIYKLLTQADYISYWFMSFIKTVIYMHDRVN